MGNRISLKLLRDLGACEPSLILYEETFGDTEQDVYEVAKECGHYDWIRWLIKDCKFCQTDKMVKIYLEKNPSYTDIRWLIENCKFCQNNESIQEYLRLNNAK